MRVSECDRCPSGWPRWRRKVDRNAQDDGFRADKGED